MAGIFTKRIWQPYNVNQTNLNGKLGKKLGGQTGGQAKIWGDHGPPRPPLESPLVTAHAINVFENNRCSD